MRPLSALPARITFSLLVTTFAFITLSGCGGSSGGGSSTSSTPQTPTLTFAPIPSEAFGNPPFQVTASSASSGAVTYSLTPGETSAGTVTSSGLVTLTGVGTVYLTANQAASGNYLAATATTSFAVADEVPVLTFATIPAETYGNPPFQVTASSASSGAITYSLTPGQTSSGTVTSSGLVTITGAGTIYLTATQAASGNFAAATATTSFIVAPVIPTLSFASIPPETYGNAPFQVSASSASSGAITYSLTPGQTSAGTVTPSGIVTITGAGTVYLTATQAASGNFASATANTSFTAAQEVPTLTFAAIPTETFGNPPFQVTASSASSGAVTYSLTPGQTSAGTVTSSGLVTLTGAGTVYLTASQAASGNYAAATATTSFAVAQEVPTLTFAAIPAETYGNPPFQVTASSASSGAVTYSLTPGQTSAGTVTSSGLVTLTGAGTVYLTANQAASGNYAAATATTSFAVAQEGATLTFAPIPAETYGNPPFQVTASSASPGAVTYSLTPGHTSAGTVTSSGLVTLTGAGTVYLTANQAASGNYAAGTATTSFAVAAEVPTLTFAPIPAETYGNAPFQVTASSASSGAVTYALTAGQTSAGTVTSSGLVTLTGAGTVYLTASQAASGNYAAATATTSFAVAQEVPTLTFATIPAETYGNAPFQVTASSASSGAVTYSLTPGQTSAGTVTSSGVVTLTGVGTVYLTANQAASGNYAAGTATTSFAVAAEVPTLTFATIPAETYGNAPFQVTASSASSGAVTYSLTPGETSAGTVTSSGIVTLTGAGTVYLTANQVASGNYAAATATTSFSVAQEVPTLTFAAIPTQTVGNPPFQVTASSASSGAVTYSLTPGQTSSGTVTSSGIVTLDSAGTIYLTANQAASGNYAAATATTSFLVLGPPVILVQPVSKNVCAGYNPSFTIGATNVTTYQWYFGASTIGTNSPTLTFNDVTTASNGTYSCKVTNSLGSLTSNTVTLNVVSPTVPAITSNPASLSVYATQTATFSVAATGTGTFSYQWYQGTPGSGSPISGATSNAYTTGPLTTANSGTTYYATVTDQDCTNTTLTSTAATLTVTDNDTALPPTIVVQPTGQTASVGGTATFSVTATGSGTLDYQWYRVPYSATELATPTAGAAISGATSSTYTVPTSATAQANDGDTYYVIITNGFGSAVSVRASLAVGEGVQLQLTGQPQSQYIAVNALASFSVTASCAGCIPEYQWYWAVPGSGTFTALSDGAVSTGALSGATVVGSATSSVTLVNVPATASGAILYATVTSTSDGSTQVPGTDPVISSTAGLFVGPLTVVGNPASGEALCNYNGITWRLNGTVNGAASAGYSPGDVPYQDTVGCTIQLTNDQTFSAVAGYWPVLIPTASFSVSFTAAVSHNTSNATVTPGDGFGVIFADPSQGATVMSLGEFGGGLGAAGTPGFLVAVDTFQDGNDNGGALEDSCSQFNTLNGACDPITVPYIAAGPTATNLWENPWTYVNGNMNTQSSSDYTPVQFADDGTSHAYVVSVANNVLTVTVDGYQVFSGTVSLPPVAYFGFTAGTGLSPESATVSNVNVTVGAP